MYSVFQGSILRNAARTRKFFGYNRSSTACTRSSMSGFDTLKYCCTPGILGFITQ